MTGSVTLDPAVRDLLAAIVDLDDATRSVQVADRSAARSEALAFLAGSVRAVVRGEALPLHAATAIRARVRGIEREWAAEATEADGS